MTRSWRAGLAGAAAAVVLLAGGAYVLTTPATYASRLSLVIVPADGAAASTGDLLAGFDDSLTQGTMVELLARDAEAPASAAGASAQVRAVPDTRVLDVEVRGARGVVGDVMLQVAKRATSRSRRVEDAWQLRAVGSPSAPVAVGPSRAVGLLAVALLAALAGLVSWLALQRFAPPAAPAAWQGEPPARVQPLVGGGRTAVG